VAEEVTEFWARSSTLLSITINKKKIDIETYYFDQEYGFLEEADLE